ncbi:hypothetical protein C0992_009137, partial [Termitomyces sp. T32_za158]
WKKGQSSPYQKGTLESVNASKTIHAWQLAKEKLVNQQEIYVRNALTQSTRIGQEELDQQLLSSIVKTPPELVLYQYDKGKDSATFDPEYMGNIFLSYLLSQALEDAADGSEKETCLYFFTVITLMHELVHWMMRKNNIKSTECFGHWFGPNIQDYGARAESGYTFEGKLCGGIIRYMGCLSSDSSFLVSQEDSKLTYDKVTNLALAGDDPRILTRRMIGMELSCFPIAQAVTSFTNHDALKIRLAGPLTSFRPEEVEMLQHNTQKGYSKSETGTSENIEHNEATVGEGVSLRRSKRLQEKQRIL